MKISVIIPTYNRARMVCECVQSVLAAAIEKMEVIVVDDCSPDDTGAAIRARFGVEPRVKYIRNERNSFQAVSRNRGAAAAGGEYLFFLDDDNRVDPAVFTELLACFARHPDAGLVAPLAVHKRPGKDSLVWTLGSDFNRWTSQPRDVGSDLPIADLPPEPVDRPTTYSPNAFCVPRELYRRLGGMIEHLVQGYEESDFGWRVMEAGHTAWIATRARTDHLGFLEPGCTPVLRGLGIERPKRTYYFARNRLYFARRHFSFLQQLSVTLVFAPLSALYYGWVALKNHRPDIARAYLFGTVAGIFGKFGG